MIDLSDGLAGDVRHLLAVNRLGAELHADAIPISRAARLRARQTSSARPPLAAALADGEDFELLFAVPRSDAVALLDAWKSQFPRLRLTCIGQVTSEPGVRLREAGAVRDLPLHGYTHFAKP
jgi:thiamine-monophosphate kinase